MRIFPSSRVPQQWHTEERMAPVPERKMFPVDKEGFRQRQAWALRRRMTDMGITAKMLANALANHPDTVSGWANGTYTQSEASVAAVDQVFQAPSNGQGAGGEKGCRHVSRPVGGG